MLEKTTTANEKDSSGRSGLFFRAVEGIEGVLGIGGQPPGFGAKIDAIAVVVTHDEVGARGCGVRHYKMTAFIGGAVEGGQIGSLCRQGVPAVGSGNGIARVRGFDQGGKITTTIDGPRAGEIISDPARGDLRCRRKTDRLR